MANRERDDNIYYARLAEQGERYEDMIRYMKEVSAVSIYIWLKEENLGQYPIAKAIFETNMASDYLKIAKPSLPESILIIGYFVLSIGWLAFK